MDVQCFSHESLNLHAFRHNIYAILQYLRVHNRDSCHTYSNSQRYIGNVKAVSFHKLRKPNSAIWN